MNYTQDHLDYLDEHIHQIGRNGHPPKLTESSSSDPALASAEHDVKMLWQATRLERLQEKLEMLKAYEGKGKAEGKAEGKAKAKAEAEENQNRTWVWLVKQRRALSVAAGILLLVAAGWFIFREQGPQEIQHAYLAAHFEEYVLHDVMRSTGASIYSQEQLAAYNVFGAGEFRTAIPLLRELWTHKSDSLAAFYLGVSSIALGKKETAVAYFEHLQQDPRYQELIYRLEQNQK